MARVPSHPFRVIVHKSNGNGGMHPTLEQHNYTSLPGAIAYRDIALGRTNTRKVEVVMVLDESTPSQREETPGKIRTYHAPT